MVIRTWSFLPFLPIPTSTWEGGPTRRAPPIVGSHRDSKTTTSAAGSLSAAISAAVYWHNFDRLLGNRFPLSRNQFAKSFVGLNTHSKRWACGFVGNAGRRLVVRLRSGASGQQHSDCCDQRPSLHELRDSFFPKPIGALMKSSSNLGDDFHTQIVCATGCRLRIITIRYTVKESSGKHIAGTG